MTFHLNQRIVTCTAVNLRAAPGYLGDAPPQVLALMAQGTACVVTGPAMLVDGLTWWPVRAVLADGQELAGWAAEQVGETQLLAAVDDATTTEPAPVEPVAPPIAPVNPDPITPRPARANRLGFYLHATDNQNGLWDAISRVQPPVILIHEDAANDMLLREIRDWRAPDAFVIGRFYVTNDAQRAMLESNDPEGEGRRFAERILTYDFGKFTRRSSNGRLFIDAWMSLNECLPGPLSGSYREKPAYYQRLYDAYDRFQVAFRDRLITEGIEAVAFNFAAGNFSEPAHYLDFFPRTLSSYVYLGFHEYGWPALFPGRGTHTGAGLYRGALNAAQQQYGARHRIVITEAGLTRAYGHPHNPDEGWLNRAETLDEQHYWESLAWYNMLLDQDDALGACLYQVGHRGDWATFRHLGHDNAGRPLHLIDRIVALRDSARQRDLQPASAPTAQPIPAQPGRLSGRVTRHGKPVAGATVRLVGDLAQLGSVRSAVLDTRGMALPVIVWDRTVAGYRGTLYQAWRDLVRGKVVDMTYAAFRRQFVAYNPLAALSARRLLADQQYLLPRVVGVDRCVLTTATSRRGRFRFPEIPSGRYTVEVEGDGVQRHHTAITMEGEMNVEIVLDPRKRG